jgi:hypothetical protein
VASRHLAFSSAGYQKRKVEAGLLLPMLADHIQH